MNLGRERSSAAKFHVIFQRGKRRGRSRAEGATHQTTLFSFDVARWTRLNLLISDPENFGHDQ